MYYVKRGSYYFVERWVDRCYWTCFQHIARSYKSKRAAVKMADKVMAHVVFELRKRVKKTLADG